MFKLRKIDNIKKIYKHNKNVYVLYTIKKPIEKFISINDIPMESKKLYAYYDFIATEKTYIYLDLSKHIFIFFSLVLFPCSIIFYLIDE